MIPYLSSGDLCVEDILEGDDDVIHVLCGAILERVKGWAYNSWGPDRLTVTHVHCHDCDSKWHPATLRRFTKDALHMRFQRSPHKRIMYSGEVIVEDVEGDKRFGRLVPGHDAHKYGKWSGKV